MSASQMQEASPSHLACSSSRAADVSKDCGPLSLLVAVGSALQASLQAVRADFERREHLLVDVEKQLECRIAEVAEGEMRARGAMNFQERRLGEARRERSRETAILRVARCRLKADAAELVGAVAATVDAAEAQVVVDVGGQRFKAGAFVLQRSPLLARYLQVAGSTTLGRPRFLRLERDPLPFRLMLNYLRHGPQYLRLLLLRPAEERQCLADEALYFELPGLAGAVVDPPVDTMVSLEVPSAVLKGLDVCAPLPHDVCSSVHVPGLCFDAKCMRHGLATITGRVAAYCHRPAIRGAAGASALQEAESHEFDRVWTVEFLGHRFDVLRCQVTVLQ